MSRNAVPSEFQEQQAVVQWWSVFCKTKGLDERLLVASANGAYLAGDSKARAIQMSRLKATGLRVGYPDLILDLPMWSHEGNVGIVSTVFHGMRLEMKRRDAPKPPPEQAGYHELLRKHGYNVIVAKGSEEAIRAIKAYVERAV